MELYQSKYKAHLFSRYFIVKEGLFKNTKKIINIYRDSLLIENVDESGREVINFDDILNVFYSESNQKEFRIRYLTSKKVEATLVFSSAYRMQLISDLLRQIDLFSKINKHPVETFKCFLYYESIPNISDYFKKDSKEKILTRRSITAQDIASGMSLPTISDITLNLYRSIIEWVQIDSKRELRIRLTDIESIKVNDVTNVIKIETFNKIDLNLIPRRGDDMMLIVEKIVENSKVFLGYQINVENVTNVPINTSPAKIQSEIFSFSKIYRLLYSTVKQEIKLAADHQYLYEIYNVAEDAPQKVSQIPISEIQYVIMYESSEEYFEVIMKTNARFLYQTSNMERNNIVTSIINILSSKYNNDETNFLVLPSKPNLGLRVKGFPNEEVDWDYERSLLNNLSNCFHEPEVREKLVEEICLNFCLKSEKFKSEVIIGQGNPALPSQSGGGGVNQNANTPSQNYSNNLPSKKIFLVIYDLIPETISAIESIIKGEKDNEGSLNAGGFDEEKMGKLIYNANMLLILCGNIVLKHYSDKLVSDILSFIETIPFQTIFYNSVSIFRNLLPAAVGNGMKGSSSMKNLKKEEIAQRRSLISLYLDNAVKIKNLLASKIFIAETNIQYGSYTNICRGKSDSCNIKIPNYEEKNILCIYILMELQKSIYDFTREINMISDIIKEFTHFDFLYILYMLMRCHSNLMKQISIEIILILMKNLSIEQEYILKNQILSRTLLFFEILGIYLKSPNEILCQLGSTFLKSFLISHVEATNLIMNLFPMTLFYFVDNNPNPINWLDHEWDTFFSAILDDHSSMQLIWNSQCRTELYDTIEKLIENYEMFTDDSSVIMAFGLDTNENEKDIISYQHYKNISSGKDQSNISEGVVSGYLSLNKNVSKTPIGILTPDRNIKHSNKLNCSYYRLNFKEIKIEYATLKKHVFVYKYYLKKIINEVGSPYLACSITKPKKFWKKLMNEMINSSNENKIVLIIKTLTLLYKIYFDSIGLFKDYEFFLKLFTSTRSIDIKIMIIQMFMVSIELSEKEYKEPNIKSLIESKSIEYFVNFLSELLPLAELAKMCDNKFSWQSLEKYYEKVRESITQTDDNQLDLMREVSNTFIDMKDIYIKNLPQTTHYYDKSFPNYTSYRCIDDSWEGADKNIKACTLVIRLIKILMKRNPLVIEDEYVPKITFPMPKVKLIFCEVKYFSTILSILYHDNENLIQETLDLILSYLNDALTYRFAGVNTNIFDIMLFYMIKYKSKTIMKYLERVYHYHGIFFNFDFLQTGNDNKRPLSEDEKEFFTQYSNANKFLVRYFPINVIYYYMTTDFAEFMKILHEDNYRCDLIWNRDMLKDLFNSLNFHFCSSLQAPNPLMFNENLRIDYPPVMERHSCFLYYVDLMKNSKIESSHVLILGRMLLSKILSASSKNSLYIYLKALHKLIREYSLSLTLQNINGMDTATNIFSSIIYENDHEKLPTLYTCLKIILLFMDKHDISSLLSIVNLLLKGFDYLFKAISRSENPKEVLIAKQCLIKIFSAITELVKRYNYPLENVEKVLLQASVNYCNTFVFSDKELAQEGGGSVMNDNPKEKKEFHVNFNLFISFLDYMTALVEHEIGFKIIMTSSFALRAIYICLKYTLDMKVEYNVYAKKSFQILKIIIEKCNAKQNEDDGLYREYNLGVKNIIGKYLYEIFSSTSPNSEDFLIKLKSDVRIPEFIWNTSFRKELRAFLLSQIKKYSTENDINLAHQIFNEILNFKYQSHANDLKIDGLYLVIYNEFPTFALSDPDGFLAHARDMLNLFSNNIESNRDTLIILIQSIANAIENSKADVNILLGDETFGTNLFKMLKYTVETISPSSMIEYSENSSTGNLAAVCLNLLYVLSLNQSSILFVLSTPTFFIVSKILETFNEKSIIDALIKILRNVYLNQIFLDKLNLSIFLFLLEKVMLLKSTITKSTRDGINAVRVDILKILRIYAIDTKVGFAIQSLFECYLPIKIIDNLIRTKEVSEQSLAWIDIELELPDLIWNHEAMNQSRKLLEDDCAFILSDENNIENFPHNFLTHKLVPQKPFFFEILDEFKIDNIYLRIFNKDPAYNIRKNLILFLQQVLSSTKESLSWHCAMNYNIDSTNVRTKQFDIIRQKLITSLTAICLIIEQINFNDFNTNIGIASPEEMKNVITPEDEYETNLIGLVQRSFEYQKLLSEEIVSKILLISKIIFGLESKLYSQFTHFDNNIRVVYLQIIYLLCLNKYQIGYVCDNFEIIEILEKMIVHQDKIGDIEFVVVLCILFTILSHDITYMSIVLTRLLDHFIELSNKRSHLLKYVQLLCCRILTDTQYGESLANSMKLDPGKYSNFPFGLATKLHQYESQVSAIWRKPPETKEQTGVIYKLNHVSNFFEENVIKSTGIFYNFENKFPFLPKVAIIYFNINDIIKDEIDQIKDSCYKSRVDGAILLCNAL